MPDYTSITVRKSSEEQYQKAKIEHQSRTGKKIHSMDFFDLLIEKFREAIK